MGPLQLLAAVGMPLAMAIGGIVAWRRSRHGDDAAKQPWHDDSLDDWRRERDRLAEDDRVRRAAPPLPRPGDDHQDGHG